MVRCIHFPFIVLLITWRKQGILGSDVNLNVEGTTCEGNNITLGCTIDPFTTIPSATWSRNGSTALTTCTSSAFCTQDDLTINNIKYSFSGNTTGIFVSFQIQRLEDDIEWICNHNATPYRYTFKVSETCKSEESSNDETGKIVGITVGAVTGSALTVAGVVVVVKKQTRVKNSEEDQSKKKKSEKVKRKEKKSGKVKRKDKTDKIGTDDVEGGGAGAQDSAGVKPVGNSEREKLKNQNSEKENQKDQKSEKENQKAEYINEEKLKTEYINEEKLKNKDASNVDQKDNHTDDKEHKEKPNDSSFNFAVGERGPPPNPQIPPARLEPIKPKQEKRKEKKIDGDENTNN